MQGLDAMMWRLVSPLLDRALDLDSEGREGLLVEVRAERPEMAALLQDLLDEHERVLRDGFLETPISRRLCGTSARHLALTLEDRRIS